MSRRTRVEKLEGRAHAVGGVIATHLYDGETEDEAWTAEHGDRKPPPGAVLVFLRRFGDKPRPAQ